MSTLRIRDISALAHKSWIAIIVVIVIVILGAGLAIDSMFDNQDNTPTITTEPISTSLKGSQTMDGILAGYVTVGPSSPPCPAGGSCNANMSGYSLEFSLECPSVAPSMTSTPCGMFYVAPLSPNGHFSILLPAGNYVMTGLVPICNWVGCFGPFPASVQVVAGLQIVLNIYIQNGQ